jgi:putative DNA methylase
MQYPKRLIEVDLPIRRISAHARREKSIRHGHISTLHIWWARRPLAACRAVLCTSLWPDPQDEGCPQVFESCARELMGLWARGCLGKCSEASFGRFNRIAQKPQSLNDAGELAAALLDFAADFASWDNCADEDFITVAQGLTLAAHSGLVGGVVPALPKKPTTQTVREWCEGRSRPLVLDSFAGGGAIPLEGLRCGGDSFGSDLNSVAVLLNRISLEYVPRYGQRLLEGFKVGGSRLLGALRDRLGDFYPPDADGAVPIAYIWARTARCEGPGCGAQVPMITQVWLTKKGSPKYGLRIRESGGKEVAVDVVAASSDKEVGPITTKGGSMVCPLCGYVTPVQSVRKQGCKAGFGYRLLAVVLSLPDSKARRFRAPSAADIRAIGAAKVKQGNGGVFETLLKATAIPLTELRRVSIPLYGMASFDDLFLDRQALFFEVLREEIAAIREELETQGEDYATAMATCLTVCASNVLHYNTNLSTYLLDHMISAFIQGTSLAMRADFAEANPLMERLVGGLEYSLTQTTKTLERLTSWNNREGAVVRADARSVGLADDCVDIVVTDPPYYDSIPYSHLADVFYLWLKVNLDNTFPDLFQDPLTNKADEIVEDRAHSKNPSVKTADHYETGMRDALREMRRCCKKDGLLTVVFAHKSTSGWEAMLRGLLDAGWRVVASWPIDTERPARMNAFQNASLLSSVHIVCRQRTDGEHVGDWREVLRELPKRIGLWLPRLAAEGVVGADAIFACLGPALEIFSRYSSVEKTSGDKVELREYLEQVWAEVAKQALNMIFEGADTAGLEEDARLTAMWLWTLRTDAEADVDTGEKVERISGYDLEYDAARKIAQGLGCHLEKLSHLVETKGETATLLSAASRARYLFGKEDVNMPKKRGKQKTAQGDLFAVLDLPSDEDIGREQAELDRPAAGKTTLDQLHQAMILFGAGRGAALKRFLVDDGVGANPQLWSLAQSLTALYPPQSEEKRWVDGVLARKKGLGF